MIARHKIGLLFSDTGTYSPLGQAMRAGAQLAIEEVNADPALDVRLEAVHHDAGGDLGSYYLGAQRMLTQAETVHVVGCYTSSSRKEVLPLFEKHDGLLWYPSHYEGFEASENVIYTGAAPNQHIVPLLRYLLRNHGSRAWCVGSNYVWAWENNRILREALAGVDINVVAERYCPVGETDHKSIVDRILQDRPDFVFCTLIGESLYSFLDSFRDACAAAGINQATEIPVASCSLSESELPVIRHARAGHLCSSVYFSTVQTEANVRFRDRWNNRFGYLGQTSADAEASYLAVHFLARALHRARTDDIAEVREAARSLKFDAPQGVVTLDPQNLHCTMRPRIGLSRQDGTFDILFEEDIPIRPDPYLVWSDLLTVQDQTSPSRLRVVK